MSGANCSLLAWWRQARAANGAPHGQEGTRLNVPCKTFWAFVYWNTGKIAICHFFSVLPKCCFFYRTLWERWGSAVTPHHRSGTEAQGELSIFPRRDQWYGSEILLFLRLKASNPQFPNSAIKLDHAISFKPHFSQVHHLMRNWTSPRWHPLHKYCDLNLETMSLQ